MTFDKENLQKQYNKIRDKYIKELETLGFKVSDSEKGVEISLSMEDVNYPENTRG